MIAAALRWPTVDEWGVITIAFLVVGVVIFVALTIRDAVIASRAERRRNADRSR
jgi:hypothetical protein